jgi:hypothetical protein
MSGKRRKSNRLAEKGAFDLDTELSAAAIREIERNNKEELDNPITDEQWIVFFCEYFEFIEKNISLCLSKIHALHNVSIGDLYKADLNGGGFDSGFNDNADYNIKLYYSLFKQFRDGENQINGCTRLNLLLSYVGNAVLRMADLYNRISVNKLIYFFRKLVVILELSVFQEVFILYMTGDSTGHTHTIDFKHRHNEATHKWYYGIWIRKQEFLAVITNKGKNFRKKYDNGLRLFVRNFLSRLIIYMRTYDSNYPLGYEKPYNYNDNPNQVLRNPLPFNGVYEYSTPIHYYYISRDDWDYIPNILLPASAETESLPDTKNYKMHPSNWKNPPPDWWTERVILLLRKKWWDSDFNIKHFTDNLDYKNLAKWLAINGTLPQQYQSHADLWDADNEDFEKTEAKPSKFAKVATSAKFGGISMMKQNVVSLPPLKKTKKSFKILSDKDITLEKIIIKELKYRLDLYYIHNISKCANVNSKCDLIDDTYTNKLNSSIILHYTDKKKAPISSKRRAATI